MRSISSSGVSTSSAYAPFVARHEGFGFIVEFPGSCIHERRRVFIKDVVAWLEFEQDGGPVIDW